MFEQSQLPIYTNSITVNITKYDFTLDVAYTADGADPNVLARIAMSPQHFKAMIEVLDANLKAYEQMYGEVNIEESPEFLKMIEQHNEQIKGELAHG